MFTVQHSSINGSPVSGAVHAAGEPLVDSLFAGVTPDQRPDGQPEENVCVANIGPEQRRQRMTFGVISLALGVALAALLVAIHANPLWRLGLFVPFVMGAEGIFQALEKT